MENPAPRHSRGPIALEVTVPRAANRRSWGFFFLSPGLVRCFWYKHPTEGRTKMVSEVETPTPPEGDPPDDEGKEPEYVQGPVEGVRFYGMKGGTE